MRRALMLLALTMTTVLGCSNELSGQLEVDGTPFVLDSCRSGQVRGFVGVELVATDGRRLAVVQTPTGSADVAVLPAGGDTGTRVPDCGAFTVADQHSTINDVKNVEGHAKLSCSANGHTVTGNVTFANCH